MNACQQGAWFLKLGDVRSAPPGRSVATRRLFVLVEETTLTSAIVRAVLRPAVLRSRVPVRTRRPSRLANGQHHHGSIAVDDNNTGEDGSVDAEKLYARRGAGDSTQPVDPFALARRAEPATNGFEEKLVDDLSH